MKTAMKAKDTTSLATIRLIRSAFSNACIDLQVKDLNDEQVRGMYDAYLDLMGRKLSQRLSLLL